MMIGSGASNEWIAPGPLNSHHAQVLNGAAWNDRCASCHAAAERPPATWLNALVGSDLGPTQSTKCMACHDKTIDPRLALVAHNVPAAKLRVAAGSLGDAEAAQQSLQLACSVCHQEHHGADHAIAAMDNTRCQSCHEQQFGSFVTDHPNFGTWPYQRRTPIAFNHATHSGKHFAEKGRPFACQQCHVEGATRNVQLTLGYEAACAECHDTDIASGTASGVALLTMPTLDVDLLNDAGFAISDWPERATGDFDGRLPAIMKLLLAADPNARKAMGILGEDFDFFDIDPDDHTHLTAVADLTTAVCQLLEQLASTAEPNPLMRGLPRELIAEAEHQWHDGGGWSATRRPGTWFSDAASLSIRYQPVGHADEVLRAWYDAVVTHSNSQLRDALLPELVGPGAPGRCTTCHSIDAAHDGQLTINWRAHDRRSEPRHFTRFSHAPHLLPIELRDCTACHAINQTADAASNYSGHNATAFVSDFHPITKAACASCHHSAAVGESCTQCHNYHVEAW